MVSQNMTFATQRLGGIGVFDMSVGGSQTAINITAPTLINPRRCILWTVHVIAPGTAGVLTLNDAATLAAANESNQFASINFANLSAGQLIPLKWPMQSGIVLSAVPTGAAINIAYNFGPYGA
jgi:hypothetical protein